MKEIEVYDKERYILHGYDIGCINDGHIALSKFDEQNATFSFILSDVHDITLFKNDNSFISRYCNSKRWSLVAINEITHVCATANSQELYQYLKG